MQMRNTDEVAKPMTEKNKINVLDLADNLARSGSFPDRWSIEKELERRGYALAHQLFHNQQRSDRLDRICADAPKKQPPAKASSSVSVPRTYSLQQR
jgi:hypothetical protein